ncbi:MAG: type II toxin-antitoxin system VapC family toxin [Puniceicoccaceae bacterium]
MILDTNAVSAFFAGDAGAVECLGVAGELYMPVIVLGEFRFGLIGSRERKTWEPKLLAFASTCRILPVQESTTVHYAHIRNQLRKAGTPIPENDIWIAALAMEHGQAVLSRDAHFDKVAKVKRVGF